MKIENWKLNLEFRILKNYLKNEVLKIKLENHNFKKLFENENFSDHLKIGKEMRLFEKLGF